MIKEWAKKWVYWLVRLTPQKNYVYMKAMPSFEDNAVAVYEQLPLDRLNLVVWSVYDKKDRPPFPLREKTVFVEKGTWKDFYYGIISKYVFTTHGHFVSRIPSNQTCVNLWHGMPFKAVGLLNDHPGRMDTYVCATSKFYQDVLSRVFGMPLERVLVTGSPRNDLLRVSKTSEVWSKAGIERDQYDKVFFWLPTYRKSVLGDLHEDGVEVDNVFNMVDFPTESFEKLLADNRCLCIIKPHPMAPKKKMSSSDHILMIDEDWLWERELTLYPLVGVVDFLVSDISSIMVDFMLLDRPMIACFEDAEVYKQSRGMLFEPIDDYLPGVLAHDYGSLTLAICQCIAGDDPAKVKREALKLKFHQFTDFQSTDRVLSVVFGADKNS